MTSIRNHEFGVDMSDKQSNSILCSITDCSEGNLRLSRSSFRSQPKSHLVYYPMRSVLVVEDDEDIRFLICEILRRVNLQTVEAENGLAGLWMTKQLYFDLIICDINMPKMDGFEFLKNLRQESSSKKPPVIMLSANADSHHQTLAFELGANAYLVKPVRIAILLATIDEQFNQQSDKLSQHLVD